MKKIYVPRVTERKVLQYLDILPTVVIVGPRQTGKTSLTGAIRNQIGRLSIYLDLERADDLLKLDDLEGFAEKNLDKLIILDEIQRYPKLFPELRSVIDRNRTNGRFLLLGSASPQLIADSSESLAGRIAFIELGGLTLPELSGLHGYRTHWYRGGFPDSVLKEGDERSTVWRESFITSYAERELPCLGLEVSPPTIRRLWTLLAHLSGEVLNKSIISRSLEVSIPTVSRYLDFLEQAYLIRRLQPYSINIKKRLVKSPKLYLRDTGILHELLAIDSYEELLSHPSLGNSWESYVVEQISLILPRRHRLFFYRTQNGAEVDLVIEKGGVIQSVVEIKHNKTPRLSKGFYIAADDLKVARRFAVAPIEGYARMKDGVWIVGPDALEKIFEL